MRRTGAVSPHGANPASRTSPTNSEWDAQLKAVAKPAVQIADGELGDRRSADPVSVSNAAQRAGLGVVLGRLHEPAHDLPVLAGNQHERVSSRPRRSGRGSPQSARPRRRHISGPPTPAWPSSGSSGSGAHLRGSQQVKARRAASTARGGAAGRTATRRGPRGGPTGTARVLMIEP